MARVITTHGHCFLIVLCFSIAAIILSSSQVRLLGVSNRWLAGLTDPNPAYQEADPKTDRGHPQADASLTGEAFDE